MSDNKDIHQVSPVQDIHGLWLDVDSFDGYPTRDYKHRTFGVEGWKLIDSAPKDGTVIDLWCREDFRTPDACWIFKAWRALDGKGKWRAIPFSPTHWMPQPEPPND